MAHVHWKTKYGKFGAQSMLCIGRWYVGLVTPNMFSSTEDDKWLAVCYLPGAVRRLYAPEREAVEQKLETVVLLWLEDTDKGAEHE